MWNKLAVMMVTSLGMNGAHEDEPKPHVPPGQQTDCHLSICGGSVDIGGPTCPGGMDDLDDPIRWSQCTIGLAMPRYDCEDGSGVGEVDPTVCWYTPFGPYTVRPLCVAAVGLYEPCDPSTALVCLRDDALERIVCIQG
jgi:hypothetical protein